MIRAATQRSIRTSDLNRASESLTHTWQSYRILRNIASFLIDRVVL